MATPLHYRGEAHKASCYSTIEVITPCIGISMEKFEQRKKTAPRRMNRSKPDDGKYQVKLVCDDQVYIACEQALLFGRAKRVSGEHASDGPLARAFSRVSLRSLEQESLLAG